MLKYYAQGAATGIKLSTYQYISDGHHTILKGTSGNEKTYITCVLDIAAFINIRHVRLQDVLNELAITHGDGTLKKVVKDYQKIGLLILDEFLLSPVYTEQTKKLLKIIEAHSVKGSVIFCTQFEPKDWYNIYWRRQRCNYLRDNHLANHS